MKIFWRRITSDPTSRLVPSALAIIPPVTKNLATALGNAKKILCHFEIPFKSRLTDLQTFVFHTRVHVPFSISSVVNIDNKGILNLV